MTGRRIRRLYFLALAGLLAVFAGPSSAVVPAAPEFVLFGTPTFNGLLATAGSVEVRLGEDPVVIARYELGQVQAYGERFVVRLPMSAIDPRNMGTARPGDEARVFFDTDPLDGLPGELAGCAIVGEPGASAEVDLDPIFNENPSVWIHEVEGETPIAVTIVEGASGQISVGKVEVWLSRPVTYQIEVDWATADGTAIGGAGSPADYRIASGTVVIPEGEVSASSSISVEVFGDEEMEPAETFQVVLTAARRQEGVSLACTPASGVDIRDESPLLDGSGTVEISADDLQWMIRVADAELLEGDGGAPVDARFLISAISEAPQSLTEALLEIGYATRDGSAIAGSDYEATSGVVSLDSALLCPETGTPCAWVTVPVLPDNVRELQENFFLDLISPDPNPSRLLVIDNVGEARIISDDPFLLFVEAKLQGTNCPGCRLTSPQGGAISPDGRSLYVAAETDSSLNVFSRDPLTGEIDLVQTQVDDLVSATSGVDGLAGVQAVVVAPGYCSVTAATLCRADAGCPTGETCRALDVYAAGFLEDEISHFTRDSNPVSAGFGTLTFVAVAQPGSTELDGPTALAVSNDGAHLYAAGKIANTLVVFSRDPVSGALAHLATLHDNQALPGGGYLDGLIEPRALALSPDGLHLYAVSAGDSSVTEFLRDTDPTSPTYGSLTYLGHIRDATSGGPGQPVVDGLNGANSLALSPDGRSLYVAGELDDAIAVFARDTDPLSPTFGRLSWVSRRKEGLLGVTGLAQVATVGVSADGGWVFAASREGNAVTVFQRDTDLASSTFGRLVTFVEARRDGDPDPYGIPIANPRLDGLAGGAGLVLSPEPDGRHLYVIGNLDDAVAVFHKDLVAPGQPVFVLDPATGATPSGHVPGQWINDPSLAVVWTAVDDAVGVGLAGYPLLFDQNPDSDPGTTLQQLHVLPDPQSRNTTLVDGTTHWFHVRACDRLDNCSPASHLGPFFIDTVPPVTPTGLHSTSHDPVGTPVSNPDLELVWTAATDPFGELAGYSLRVDHAPATGCGEALDLPAAAVSTTAAGLADGSWYVHVCAGDLAGNWGPTAHAGPYVIDTTPPVVTSVGSVAATEAGGIVTGDVTEASITQLLVTFDDVTIAGAENRESYRLWAAGADGTLEVDGCVVSAITDRFVGVVAVSWDPSTVTAALHLEDSRGYVPLEAGLYRFFVCGNGRLEDGAGNFFDGNGDGVPGGDFLIDFEVLSSNLLANPNLDADLGWWTLSEGVNFVHDSLADADGAPTSGSVWLGEDFLPAATFTVDQCVAAPAGEPMDLGGRVQLVSSMANEPSAQLRVEFFQENGCTGLPLSGASTPVTAGDSGGAWVDLIAQGISSPQGAVSARVQAEISGNDASGSEVSLDRFFFRLSDALFRDGFESGDTAVWSSATP